MTQPSQNWTKLGNLRGPQGPAGATGQQGATGAAGQRGTQWFPLALSTAGTVPNQSNTIVGDFVIDTNTGDYYQRTA